MLSAKDVEAVVFLRQDTPLTCTGGFRSQDKIDVSVVAAKFGGGGHDFMAAFDYKGNYNVLNMSLLRECKTTLATSLDSVETIEDILEDNAETLQK